MFALQVNAVTEPPKTKDGEISSPFVFGGGLVPSTPYSGKRLRRRRRISVSAAFRQGPWFPKRMLFQYRREPFERMRLLIPQPPAFLKKIRYGVSNAPLENTSKRHPIRTKVSKGGREPRRGLEGREVWGPLWGKAPTLASGLHQLSFKTVMPPISSTIPSQAQGLRRCPSRSQPPMEVPRMPNPPHMA